MCLSEPRHPAPATLRKAQEENGPEWGTFLYLIVSVAPIPACRKIKKMEGRERKGTPSTKALNDIRFRHLQGKIIKELQFFLASSNFSGCVLSL